MRTRHFDDRKSGNKHPFSFSEFVRPSNSSSAWYVSSPITLINAVYSNSQTPDTSGGYYQATQANGDGGKITTIFFSPPIRRFRNYKKIIFWAYCTSDGQNLETTLYLNNVQQGLGLIVPPASFGWMSTSWPFSNSGALSAYPQSTCCGSRLAPLNKGIQIQMYPNSLTSNGDSIYLSCCYIELVPL